MSRAFERMVFVLAVLLVSASLSQAVQERRVALVIGNGRYDAVPRLPNPAPDAEMVATTLREAGFDSVTLADDLTREKLIEALRKFSADASNADWAMIYYAGHGIEMGGMNYLIPTDARLTTDRDLQFEAVPLSQAMAAVDGAHKLRLIVLDACRDNPFAAKMTRSLGTTRSIGRGLARVEPDVGTLVAYAAKDGQVAEDGAGAHSPFVTSLVRHMRTPGLEVARLFRRVTSDVLVATNHRQEPFTYGSLPDEDFYFRGPPASAAPAVDANVGSEAAIAPSPRAVAEPMPAAATVVATPAAAPPSLVVGKPSVLSTPALVPAPPKELHLAAPEAVASVEPRATPPARERPVSPPIKSRPLVKAKPIPKPEPVVVRPHRVVQQEEPPEPRVARPIVRSRPSVAPAKPSAHCLVFNGERVCN